MRPGKLGVLLLALTAVPAWAQDNNALPYSDEPAKPSAPPQAAPEGKGRTDKTESLTRQDDPSFGLGAELHAGLLLLSSPRGQFGEPVFSYGLHVTWDFGRLFDEDWIHEGFFVDLNWTSALFHAGDDAVNSDTMYQFITVAPAFELPFSTDSPYGAYLQLGGGIALTEETLRANGGTTHVQGQAGLFQYGLGIRGRPRLSEDGKLRLTFRIEVMRYRRGYLDDNYAGGAIGLAF